MSRRGDETNTKALDIVIGVAESLNLQFTAVARTSIDLAYRQAAVEACVDLAAQFDTEIRQLLIIGGWRSFGDDTGAQRLLENSEHGGYL